MISYRLISDATGEVTSVQPILSITPALLFFIFTFVLHSFFKTFR